MVWSAVEVKKIIILLILLHFMVAFIEITGNNDARIKPVLIPPQFFFARGFRSIDYWLSVVGSSDQNRNLHKIAVTCPIFLALFTSSQMLKL